MAITRKIGKVFLAGAGPGDPDLITIKLRNKLADADVIITDRLVNPTIIGTYAREDALVLQVGKQGYSQDSFSQEKINQLIVEHALAGKTVVRLKGGDVAFFSNVLDELIALQEHNIPYEIIPGITAASGASACTGIPLTARGYAQGVQFIAFNPNNGLTDEDLKALASTSDTLVFYMAARNLIQLASRLMYHSKNPCTGLAVVEQATTVHQRVHVSTLKDCIADFSDIQFSSPSLVIIGDVVKLYEQFNWFTAGKEGGVFSELSK